MKVYKNKEEQMLVEERDRAEEKEMTAKEAGRREATGRRELTNYKRTFKGGRTPEVKTPPLTPTLN